MSEYNYIKVGHIDGVAVVELVNPNLLDRLLISELGDELIDFVEQSNPKNLIISFEHVTYCSSEVIGSLIRARSRVVTDHQTLKLCSMNDDVRKLFKLTNLDGTLFTIYDDSAQAIASF